MANAKEARFDSSRQQLGTVYAKGLVAAADKAGQLDQVLAELESVVTDVFGKLPQFFALLSSSRIDFAQKEKMLDQAFAGKSNKMNQVLLNALKVMGRHNRLDCVPAMAQAARKLFNVMRGQVEVHVRTAQPLDAKLRENIIARLKERLGRNVDLRTEVRPEMLGGLMVRIGDTLFDGSLVNKLEKMRVAAIEDTVAKMRSEGNRFSAG